jgi:hypothetical protein
VTTLDGGRVWTSAAFTVGRFPAPAITAVPPTTQWSRNTSVSFVITGTNFQPGLTTVNFTYPSNGTELNITPPMKIQALNATTLTGVIVIPGNAASGSWNASVTTRDGGRAWKSSAFTVGRLPAPSATSMTPISGFRNTTVAFTITGTNFEYGFTRVGLSNPGSPEIPATLYSVSPTQIIGGVRIPGKATNGPYKLNITTLDGGLTSKPSVFAISKLPPSVITAFAPNLAYRGTTVSFIVNGTYFQPGNLTTVVVSRSGQAEITTALKSVSTTQIAGNLTVPGGALAGPWNVNVTTVDGGNTTKLGVMAVI